MIYLGIVTDNADPREVGRVRARVKGRFEPHTDWLMPAVALGDGEKEAGGFRVPRKDSMVLVFFADGVLSKGYYMVPNRSGYGREDEMVIPFGDFEIAVAENSVLRVRDIDDSGYTTVKVEMQAGTGSILVTALNVVNIQASAIKLDAADVTIMGRKVKPTGEEI